MLIKILVSIFIFTGGCTFSGINDMVSLVALTVLVIVISQYIGLVKFKIEKSRRTRC